MSARCLASYMLCVVMMYSVLKNSLDIINVYTSRLVRPRNAAMRPLSELFTHSTALKLTNTLAKPPLKLSLSYY